MKGAYKPLFILLLRISHNFMPNKKAGYEDPLLMTVQNNSLLGVGRSLHIGLARSGSIGKGRSQMSSRNTNLFP